MTGLRINWEDLVATLVGTFILVFVVYAIAIVAASASLDNQCLRHGWAESRVTWNFQKYCIREENEYEITKPLFQILEERR